MLKLIDNLYMQHNKEERNLKLLRENVI